MTARYRTSRHGLTSCIAACLTTFLMLKVWSECGLRTASSTPLIAFMGSARKSRDRSGRHFTSRSKDAVYPPQCRRHTNCWIS